MNTQAHPTQENQQVGMPLAAKLGIWVLVFAVLGYLVFRLLTREEIEHHHETRSSVLAQDRFIPPGLLPESVTDVIVRRNFDTDDIWMRLSATDQTSPTQVWQPVDLSKAQLPADQSTRIKWWPPDLTRSSAAKGTLDYQLFMFQDATALPPWNRPWFIAQKPGDTKAWIWQPPLKYSD